MPTLYLSKHEHDAIESGDLRCTIVAQRGSGLPHVRVGETIRLFTRDKQKYPADRAGVATCVGVMRFEVGLDGMTIGGRTIAPAEALRIANATITKTSKRQPLTHVAQIPVWFTNTVGAPLNVGDRAVPFRGELISWGELTEVGAFTG